MRNINSTKIEINKNLNYYQLYHLKKFVATKPFSVIQCDKNIGTAILSNDLLHELSINHLSDDKIYEQVNTNPLGHNSFLDQSVSKCIKVYQT